MTISLIEEQPTKEAASRDLASQSLKSGCVWTSARPVSRRSLTLAPRPPRWHSPLPRWREVPPRLEKMRDPRIGGWRMESVEIGAGPAELS